MESSGSSLLRITKAEARVACPQRSTSVFGVSQRMAYRPPLPTKNAVSDRLFSAAIA